MIMMLMINIVMVALYFTALLLMQILYTYYSNYNN